MVEVSADDLPFLMRGTCEPHGVRLGKGLTLPFDSTSVANKTGKATVRLVDPPLHSQMPSNDDLATSKVLWCSHSTAAMTHR